MVDDDLTLAVHFYHHPTQFVSPLSLRALLCPVMAGLVHLVQLLYLL